jgi:hypothetical protein
MYQGKCHCGNIAFQVEGELAGAMIRIKRGEAHISYSLIAAALPSRQWSDHFQVGASRGCWPRGVCARHFLEVRMEPIVTQRPILIHRQPNIVNGVRMRDVESDAKYLP